MNTFNLIAGVCSILGLLISIFVATKVFKISNSINNNSVKVRDVKVDNGNFSGRDTNVK
jgi:di/tricarboxylate transporter